MTLHYFKRRQPVRGVKAKARPVGSADRAPAVWSLCGARTQGVGPARPCPWSVMTGKVAEGSVMLWCDLQLLLEPHAPRICVFPQNLGAKSTSEFSNQVMFLGTKQRFQLILICTFLREIKNKIQSNKSISVSGKVLEKRENWKMSMN